MSRGPVMNIDEVELQEWGDGEHHAARLGALAGHLGAQKLGYRLVELEPGKSGWPAHAHYVNEEMFFILDGEGTLRIGDELYPLRRGDVVAVPPGPQTPHMITNTSAAPLRYLAVSTMEEPDIVEYPDSDKVGVFVGAAPGGDKQARRLAEFYRHSDRVDYWDGE